MTGWPIVVVLLLAACGAADDSLPLKPPKPKPKPKLGMLSIGMGATQSIGIATITSARLVAQYTAAAAPYVADPRKIVNLSV